MYYWIRGELPTFKLSENFKRREFECKCRSLSCNWNKVDDELVKRLQKIREELGLPIKITSGFRCKEHNDAIGGSKNSQHAKGKAVDITCKDMDRLEKLCEKYFQDGGFARSHSGNFIHVDTRGVKARWEYK